MKNDKALEVKKVYDLAKPNEVTEMATILRSHILANNLYTSISGKKYVHVEGWTFAGGIMGLFPRIKSVENLSVGNEFKWKSEAEIIDRRTGNVVSIGIAICSTKENKKKTFDEYAVLSMAQTRAIGKAYRNLIGWVIKLSGYEGTPSEEMGGLGEKHPEPHRAEPAVQQGAASNEALFCIGKNGKGCPDGNTITTAEKNYSVRIFKKALCRDCQKAK